MKLKTITLVNFKNYEKLQLSCAAKLNFLVGPNGAGKTNLLDAIYYLCFCKSYFNSSEQQNVRHQQRFFRLDGVFMLNGIAENIVAKIALNKRKEIVRNDLAYSKLSQHIGLLPLVMIAPDDIQLVKAGSEARRKLLDSTLSQIDKGYLKTLIQYHKLLQQRNAYLKKCYEEQSFDIALLQIYDEQLVPLGIQLYHQRKKAIGELLVLLQKYYEWISDGKEEVNCVYKSSLNKSGFAQILHQNLLQDRHLQRTTDGLHRDDLLFEINNYPLKKFGSQGQQKSFLIALKLAQYQLLKQKHNTTPILLLDDIFDKLDPIRTRKLVDAVVSDDFGQVFISDTELERMKKIFDAFEIEQKLFKITDGKVEVMGS